MNFEGCCESGRQDIEKPPFSLAAFFYLLSSNDETSQTQTKAHNSSLDHVHREHTIAPESSILKENICLCYCEDLQALHAKYLV